MATVEVSLTGGAAWTEVATEDQVFLIENRDAEPVLVTLQDIAPDLGETAYHILNQGQAIFRMELNGAAYVRAANNTSVIVTT